MKKVIYSSTGIIVFVLIYMIIGSTENLKRCFRNAYTENHTPSPRVEVHLDKVGSSTVELSLPGEALFENGGEIYFEFAEKNREPESAFHDSLDAAEIYITITNTRNEIVENKTFFQLRACGPLPVNEKENVFCFGKNFINLNSDNKFFIEINVKKPIEWLKHKPHYMFLQYDTKGYWKIALLYVLVAIGFLVFLLVLTLILFIFYIKKIKNKTLSTIVYTAILFIVLLIIVWNKINAII